MGAHYSAVNSRDDGDDGGDDESSSLRRATPPAESDSQATLDIVRKFLENTTALKKSFCVCLEHPAEYDQAIYKTLLDAAVKGWSVEDLKLSGDTLRFVAVSDLQKAADAIVARAQQWTEPATVHMMFPCRNDRKRRLKNAVEKRLPQCRVTVLKTSNDDVVAVDVTVQPHQDDDGEADDDDKTGTTRQ